MMVPLAGAGWGASAQGLGGHSRLRGERACAAVVQRGGFPSPALPRILPGLCVLEPLYV